MTQKTIRTTLAAAAVIAVGVPSAAIGFGEGRTLRLGERNPSSNGTLAVGAETEIISEAPTYGTRQSNKRDGDGGGAIYGCRSSLGNEPCIRSNNLKGGRAFEFATAGKEAGRIELGDPAGAPLTTNATGVATGFNADRVDGRDGAELASASDLRFAVVDEQGKLTGDRGAATAALASEDTDTVAVTFDAEVKSCSFTASPAGSSSSAALGVSAGTDGKTVLVDFPDGSTRTGFHLQVLC